MPSRQAHSPVPAAPAATDELARSRGIQRATLVAILTNSLLTIGQVVIGLFAGAFSLVADAAHTLSDLVTDLLVLLAGRHSADPADTNHPYGHGRIETVTTLVLGAVLGAVGVGFLWSSGIRLQDIEALPVLHPAALVMALLTLAAKEGLFRYTLAAARRLNAPMLEANAWHARSDAASSLVVAAGIGGSLAGYPFLEPLAAAVVGFLILHMGLRLAWKSIGELIDTGLPEEELERLRATIRETPGVIGLHDMRTRRMADRVLCDAHVQVDPRLTVSEGHRVSDAVYLRVRAAHPEVRDVLVHIDPEDDGELQVVPPGPLPERVEILARMRELLGPAFAEPRRVQIHYLGQRVEVEIILPSAPAAEALEMLQSRRKAWLAEHPHYRNIRVFVETAP
ncbi:MAG TPA: cation diffusion facilitator family transporter [Thauera sp.]|jgi:cation diffusion facilitator family transporter|uniref:cation diffusion facilitator family transporter n=1 Tax=Thauera sp. TaxID=1905334 RepID=UPI000FBCA143|nr:cation diffusion facilitator family transporter [Thauera sp.]RTL21827.1 MAG: cation transporter [Rhodocyclaceae bacterium]MCB1944539.1 cation transporter [Thauera sp.]MCP5226203.1 cation transporter [Thauera sp.]HPE03052.1 cation diffusion facilitator family transporter [Thauera sp.]HRV78880.1 cation diffusion facilitator family transporter [Thauera sp.]